MYIAVLIQMSNVSFRYVLVCNFKFSQLPLGSVQTAGTMIEIIVNGIQTSLNTDINHQFSCKTTEVSLFFHSYRNVSDCNFLECS